MLLKINLTLQDYVGSGDYGTDDEDYDDEDFSIDYGNEDYYYPENVEPVIDNAIDTNENVEFEGGSEAISDLVVRITLLMKSPWNKDIGMMHAMKNLKKIYRNHTNIYIFDSSLTG